MSPVSASSGYPSPTVAVASTLPKRKVASSVLIVPILSGDDDGPATVVANSYLDAEAVGEIEVALEALGADDAAERIAALVAGLVAHMRVGTPFAALHPDPER